MRHIFKLILLYSVILFCSCQKETPQVYGRYYAPTIFVNGQEEETMLTTVFATLDITQREDGTADMSLLYRGPEDALDGKYGISEFYVNLHNVSLSEGKGTLARLSGEDIEAELFYEYVDPRGKKKQDSMARKFIIEGTLDPNDATKTSVTVSSVIFDEELSITLNKMTRVESEADFGILGYPWVIVEMIHANRTFLNNTDHSVTVGHQRDKDGISYQVRAVISAHEKGRVVMLDTDDNERASYTLTFDDGRISRHSAEENRYHYAGLPVEVIEKPSLFVNSGQICYDIFYNCTYTITPEIYNAAQ